jgi:hypothetical protein
MHHHEATPVILINLYLRCEVLEAHASKVYRKFERSGHCTMAEEMAQLEAPLHVSLKESTC